MYLSKKCIEVAQLARGLMASHGLHDWSFNYNKGKHTLGLCYHRRKIIALSAYLVDNNPLELITDIILHEIAHALAGHAAGHGPAWKKICLQIGAKPTRCCEFDDLVMPKSNHHTVYKAQCSMCNKTYKRYRLSRKPGRFYYCLPCGKTMGRLLFERV
jgi:predicted SprT family Zn-dependent metalloprotease